MNNAYVFVRHFRIKGCSEGDSLFHNEAEQKFALVNEGLACDLWSEDWSDDEIGKSARYKYDTLEDLNRDLLETYDEEISMEDL